MPDLDLGWWYGVPGWRHDGRHYTLAQLSELFPEHAAWLRRRHLHGMLLLALCQLHLRRQLQEVTWSR